MWRLLSLFLFLSQIMDAASANCTSGWTDLGNGICQSGIRGYNAQNVAYGNCASMNAYMPTIANAFENNNVSFLNSAYKWLGLTCTSSEPTSCLWDNGVSIINTSYTNFAIGQPNINIGVCVYMSSNSLWYSSDCTKNTNPSYYCRTAPGVYVPQCASPAYYFRGHCYYAIGAPSYGKAVTPCNANCGNIASIHNDGENSYVRDIANTKTTNAYTFIGMTYANGAYKWDDGTQMNFDKFGLQKPELGSCALMATLGGGVVAQGRWLSGDCSDLSVAVCKTDVTCSIATEAPPTCTDVQYLSGAGDILSPNYPLGSGPNYCQYVITESADLTVDVTVQELYLDGSSTIKLYNSPLDTTPFMTLNNNSKADNATTYFSAGNFLRILFDTPGSITFRNHWKISYGVHQTGGNNCGGTFSKSPEVISGPHRAQNCTYSLRMGATTGRTCIRLSELDVESGDSISIYDGTVDPQNRIGFVTSTINGYSRYFVYPALCTTTSNYMTIVTTGQSGLGYEMFELTAADSPEILNPQPILFSYNGGTAAVPTSVNRPYPGSNAYGYDLYTTDPNSRVRGNFTYLNMPFPDYIFIMDGNNAATVALAYGSLVNSRMIYQTSGQHFGIWGIFNPGSSSVGFTGYFTAV